MDKYAALSSSPYAPQNTFADNFSSADSVFGSGSLGKDGAFSKSSFDIKDNVFAGSDFGSGAGGFGDSGDSGAMTPSDDPFGSVDPFKDLGIKEDDRFSWDDEPDPFMTDSGVETSNANNLPSAKKDDPFSVTFDANKNVIGEGKVSANEGNQLFSNFGELPSSSSTANVACGGASGRSKSVLADPIASLLSVHSSQPVRSKTAMADPIMELNSFDPLAATGNSPKKLAWLSNEDLINENFGSSSTRFKDPADSFGSAIANNSNSKLDFNNAFSSSVDFNSSFSSSGTKKRPSDEFSFGADFSSVGSSQTNGSKGASPYASAGAAVAAEMASCRSSSSISTRSSGGTMSETEQLSWAARESLRFEKDRKTREEQEYADLQRALALSTSSASKKKPS